MAKRKKAAATTGKKAIRKGRKAIGDAGVGTSDFVRISDGDVVDMVSLVNMDDLLSIDQHAIWLDGGNSPMFPCIGEDCPGCEVGNQPRFRAFLPVVLVEEGVQKIYSFGISVARALEELDDEFEGLAGHVFRIKRKGTGLGTTYTVIAMGRTRKIDKYDALDVEEKLGPVTRKGILDLLEETGALEDTSDEDDEEEEEEEPAPRPKKKKGKKVAEESEEEEEVGEEDEDWDEV